MILAATLAAAVGGSAHAQDAAADADLRCAAVIYYLHATDEKPSDEGLRAVLYFLGRVQAHEPKIDIQTRLPQAIRDLAGPKMVDEVNRCAGVFSAGTDELDKVMPAAGRVIDGLPKS
jgi:hypothetical protein